MLGKLFSVYDMELGKFYNMLVVDDWAAIRYSTYTVDKKTGAKIEQMTMEFVHFKDNPEPIGARVIEGWALCGQASFPAVMCALTSVISGSGAVKSTVCSASLNRHNCPLSVCSLDVPNCLCLASLNCSVSHSTCCFNSAICSACLRKSS